jgi:hypothetical protein
MVLTYTTQSTCSTCNKNGLAFGTQLGVLGVDHRIDITAKRLGGLKRCGKGVRIHVNNMRWQMRFKLNKLCKKRSERVVVVLVFAVFTIG